ncbi:hypothetical protein N7468_007608 [Penicillium chermesinum]|uniref:Uncharacterized protein n=1 Tax=Penicillium chermesinum TaxID=63820 RepID=A0A9W9TKU1_9EURO|nr:uncharacterized protein N7468_007608 [Penicillium chermesinum]KAJ5226383.1 hypothetical protein N7468_007608 [Penicillium chermesinum]
MFAKRATGPKQESENIKKQNIGQARAPSSCRKTFIGATAARTEFSAAPDPAFLWYIMAYYRSKVRSQPTPPGHTRFY